MIKPLYVSPCVGHPGRSIPAETFKILFILKATALHGVQGNLP
jgi:hypothetical protein